MAQTVLSLCSGIGGLDLGFRDGAQRAGIETRTVCLVERETFCVSVLVHQMQKGAMDPCPVWLGDLADLPVADLPRIDWVIGGYPCQPFAHIGRRLGAEDPRHLWPQIRRILQHVQPRGVFFENVAGHLTLGLSSVLQDLEGCGFRSAFGLFSAQEVGAPHRRERVFILGLADTDSEGLEGHAGDVEATKWTPEREDGHAPPCCLRNGGWQQVVFADELEGDREDGIGFCPCFLPYVDIDGSGSECLAPGPTEDGFEYQQVDGILYGRRVHQWVARPGEPQREHEPPRTTEPGMGRGADGLPSRVDRLRALGNAVVPAQAALAFETLYHEVTETNYEPL